MTKCDFCGILIRGDAEYCPLCHEKIVKGTDFPLYPPNTVNNKSRTGFNRIFWFLYVLALAVCFVVNRLATSGPEWWLLAGAFMLYVPLLIRNTIMSKIDTARKIFNQIVYVALILILVRLVLGSESTGWILDYVLPILLGASSLFYGCMVAFGVKKFHTYIIYELGIIVFGAIPILLYLFKVITELIPSLVSAMASFAVLLSNVFFVSKEMREEIKKKFHM